MYNFTSEQQNVTNSLTLGLDSEDPRSQWPFLSNIKRKRCGESVQTTLKSNPIWMKIWQYKYHNEFTTATYVQFYP